MRIADFYPTNHPGPSGHPSFDQGGELLGTKHVRQPASAHQVYNGFREN
jgi:hypothetical protein